jgi:hypothetical protein
VAYGSELPSRSPVGTKFVIEGRCCGENQVQTISRYLEFPKETFFPLPARPIPALLTPKAPILGRPRIRRRRKA